MAVVFATVASSLGIGRTKAREAANRLSKDIQTAYFQAVRKGKVYRLVFEINSPVYRVEYLQLEQKLPPENEEELRVWEEEQEERQRELEALSPQERREQLRLDRAEFVPVKERELTYPVVLKEFQNVGRSPESEQALVVEEGQEVSLFVYPNGDMDFAYLYIEADPGDSFSLITHPLTGRVKSASGKLSQQEWKTLWLD